MTDVGWDATGTFDDLAGISSQPTGRSLKSTKAQA